MAKGIKTGGRQKGTSNKLTGTVKEMVTHFVTNEMQHLPTLLNQLEPKEKADFIIKLLPYILPKIAPVDAPKEVNKNHLIFSMFNPQHAQENIKK